MKIKEIIENSNYLFIDPNEYDKGHGNILSIKVVIPTYCQANCDFCFNKLNNNKRYNIEEFLDNIDKSLFKIFSSIKRNISIDITGNEPTFNIELLYKTLVIINKYRKKISKIVLTTNGYKIRKCMSFINLVDIINISVHHYDFNIRKEVFRTNNILNDIELKDIVSKLNSKHILVSAVCVINSDIDDINTFFNKLIDWSINIGFKDIRIRSNYLKNDSYMNSIYNIKIGEVIKCSEVPGLKYKVIYLKDKDYYIYILLGVESLVNIVIGAEMIIDDDGLIYIDYNKEYCVNDNELVYFNNLYVLGDIKKETFK